MESGRQGTKHYTALNVQVTIRTFCAHNALPNIIYSGVCAWKYACDHVFLLKTSVHSYYLLSPTIIPLLQTCRSRRPVCYTLYPTEPSTCVSYRQTVIFDFNMSFKLPSILSISHILYSLSGQSSFPFFLCVTSIFLLFFFSFISSLDYPTWLLLSFMFYQHTVVILISGDNYHCSKNATQYCYIEWCVLVQLKWHAMHIITTNQ